MDRPTYDIARFSGVVVIDPIIRPVLLPSFISHETTPNLRRLSVDIPPQQWLEMINFSQPEFATQLSIHLHFNWDWRHRLVEWQSSFIRWAQNLQDDLFYETKWNFRSTNLELHWSHEHSKNADHIKHASIPYMNTSPNTYLTGVSTIGHPTFATGHFKFTERQKDFADLTYTDNTGAMHSFLTKNRRRLGIDKSALARWSTGTTYHFEVKATPNVYNVPFYPSENQVKSMETRPL
ncbi:hypothetical protein QBC37DRAFT_453404 [Rhypophila decipiens]|uniref:Uncharacterized protein n=1 Tax=Rhypophila decipiens TaxID=261697 RepID=A0AAN7B2X2_9PEZI|nr:hypothetical protein QBC37DRAFT_453404 [Rhypophila decipiens]